MYKRTKQFIGFFERMMQVVSWSDLHDRMFRPVIMPNPLMVGPIRVGLIGNGCLYAPINSASRPPDPFGWKG